MILDIGCGANPHGDINLDVGPDIRATDSGSKTRANVYGSVLHLPFKDSSVQIVYFNGLLHHIWNVESAWKEIVRVSKEMIVGREPHVLNPKARKDPNHAYKGFTYQQIRQICEPGTSYLRVAMSSQFRMPRNLYWDILAMRRHP